MAAMNKINSARREREAAVEKAEGAKILAVRAAEAEAEAKHLSGMGTAKMRTAITSGFATSIESMKESCGLEPREVVHMMLVTQYLDVLKDFAQSGKATMVVPHGISAVADIEGQVRLCVFAFFASVFLSPSVCESSFASHGFIIMWVGGKMGFWSVGCISCVE
jgi:ABC-type histidine transport system ATPase subunit